jgi:hypothetical protein
MLSSGAEARSRQGLCAGAKSPGLLKKKKERPVQWRMGFVTAFFQYFHKKKI